MLQIVFLSQDRFSGNRCRPGASDNSRRFRRAAVLASISTTTFYPNVFVPHGFRIALILWLPCLVALVQRGTDPTNSSASIPNPLS